MISQRIDPQQGVCAVIVSYNPDNTLENAVLILIEQVDRVIIIDNNSNEDTKQNIYSIEHSSAKISVTQNNDNMGVAYALNQGIKKAINLGFEWIITLDDDSIFSEGSIVKMVDMYKKFEKELKIGIIAPQYIYTEKNNNHMVQTTKENILINQKLLLSSGCLINTKVFTKTGFFKSSYFIDYIDTEFCLRLRNNGYNLYTLPSAKLYHSLGKVFRKRLLFYSFAYTMTESNERWYYKYRNRIHTYKLYNNLYPDWVLEDIYLAIKELFKIVLLGPERYSCLRLIIRGVVDGINGISGKALNTI